MSKLVTFFSLFSSLSTLLCCALPVTLVSIGMGASFASLTANVPQLIWLVERKNMLFMIAGFLLVASYLSMKKAKVSPCPTDLKQRQLCEKSKTLSFKVWSLSLVFYLVGGFFSFLLPQLMGFQ